MARLFLILMKTSVGFRVKTDKGITRLAMRQHVHPLCSIGGVAAGDDASLVLQELGHSRPSTYAPSSQCT